MGMPPTGREAGANYGALLENPLLFLIFSQQAAAETRMLELSFGDPERCITVYPFVPGAGWPPNDRGIGIELVESNGTLHPNFDQAYSQDLELAVRRTKLHKYGNRNDIVVCAVLDSENPDACIAEICRRLYSDLETAYFNHVYFDFYFMMTEGFTATGSLWQKNCRILDQLEALSQEEWVRYVFLISDITNEELVTSGAAEQFQAVLHSAVLTNCRSSTGAGSALVNERLNMEAQNLESKFLSLGRIELAAGQELVRAMIRHALLEEVFRLPAGRRKAVEIPMDMDGLQADILQEIQQLMRPLEKIAAYRCMTSKETAEFSNQEVISLCFRSNAEKYALDAGRRLSETCRRWMHQVYDQQVMAWLDGILYQSGADICDPDCCRKAYRALCRKLEEFLQENGDDRRGCTQDFMSWKKEKVRIRAWRKWFPANNWQFRILERWQELRSYELACDTLEQCLRDMEFCAGSWLRAAEDLCRRLDKLRLDAAQAVKAKLNDCCETERRFAEFYQQRLKNDLADHQGPASQLRRELNGLLQRRTGPQLLENCIQEHTSRFHSNWTARMGSAVDWPRLGSAQDLACLYEALRSSLLRHTVLYMRGQAVNIDPYICVLGQEADALVQYMSGQGREHDLVFKTESEMPLSIFYYQNIRGPGHMPSCQIHRRRAQHEVGD